MGLSKKQACEILGLNDGTDLEAILSSYKKLGNRWHPIKNKNSEESKKKFQAVTLAYKTLSSPNSSDKNMTLSEMLELFQQLFSSRTIECNGFDSSASSGSSEEDTNFNNKISENLKNKNDRQGFKSISDLTYEKAQKNADALIEEEEKEKKKAEKKRDKKKKRREKKKLEKEGQKNKIEMKSSNEPSYNSKSDNKKNNKKKTELNSSGSDDDLDSANTFVASTSNKNKIISSAHNINKSKNNKQNSRIFASDQEQNKDDIDPVVLQSRQLAIQGNEMANLGEYIPAVDLFSQAIKLDPRDYRFYGNRSYCYDRLHQYDRALQDAEKAIALAPNWPKGHFRKGRALTGLKLYSEAEISFEQVLKLDKNCEDASQELLKVRVRQLVEMGFSKRLSKSAIRQHKQLQPALDALLATHRSNSSTVTETSLSELYISDEDNDLIIPMSESSQITTPVSSDEKMNPKNPNGLTSLWVGNVLPEVAEQTLTSMFSKYGTVTSIRNLPEKYCAFVNFKSKETAGKAMEALQGVECAGQKLLIKFPDNPQGNSYNSTTVIKKNSKQSNRSAPKQSGPVNGDECYFWRTTGCVYGERCRYKHLKEHKGVDKKPWQNPS